MKLLLIAGVFSISAAVAAPIPFTGTLGDGFDLHSLMLSGSGFSFQSVQPEGTGSGDSNAGYRVCFISCDLSETFDATGSLFSGYRATYNGQTITGFGFASMATGTIGGQITFVAPLFHSSDCGIPAPGQTCPAIPITFSGDLFARYSNGMLLFDFPVSGTGALTVTPRIQGGTFVSAYQINAQLTGQAGDAAPEPATWTLFGAAAIFLGGIGRLKSN